MASAADDAYSDDLDEALQMAEATEEDGIGDVLIWDSDEERYIKR